MHSRPVGAVTRGTTNANRLRRQDRWLAGPQAWRLRRSDAPVVVDLGYGASPITAVELHTRLRAVRRDVRTVGIEIEPSRVEMGRRLLARTPLEGLSFARGGFEVPLPGGERPVIVRAANVLRQYDESEVADAWAHVLERLAPGGLLLDGTCDELGRRSTWVALEASGPVSLTLSYRLAGLADPADIAPRLVKALIHRNVPGERIHDYLAALSHHWTLSAPLAPHGARQRFIATARAMRASGWPLLDDVHRWRLGEITVAWAAVAPADDGARITRRLASRRTTSRPAHR